MCFDFGLSDTVLEAGTVPFAFFEMMRFPKDELAKKWVSVSSTDKVSYG